VTHGTRIHSTTLSYLQAVGFTRVAPHSSTGEDSPSTTSMKHGSIYHAAASFHRSILYDGSLPPGDPCVHGSPLHPKTSVLGNPHRSNTRISPLCLANSDLKAREDGDVPRYRCISRDTRLCCGQRKLRLTLSDQTSNATAVNCRTSKEEWGWCDRSILV